MKRELLELRLAVGSDPRFLALVREYADRFGAAALNYRQYNGLEGLELACLLLRGGRAVACGAFQRLEEGTAELKRLYVRKDCRRRGYARQLVEMLELQALFAGYNRMALETGRTMPEARSLYTGLGYRETEAWEAFAGDPAVVCMIKTLA